MSHICAWGTTTWVAGMSTGMSEAEPDFGTCSSVPATAAPLTESPEISARGSTKHVTCALQSGPIASPPAQLPQTTVVPFIPSFVVARVCVCWKSSKIHEDGESDAGFFEQTNSISSASLQV